VRGAWALAPFSAELALGVARCDVAGGELVAAQRALRAAVSWSGVTASPRWVVERVPPEQGAVEELLSGVWRAKADLALIQGNLDQAEELLAECGRRETLLPDTPVAGPCLGELRRLRGLRRRAADLFVPEEVAAKHLEAAHALAADVWPFPGPPPTTGGVAALLGAVRRIQCLAATEDEEGEEDCGAALQWAEAPQRWAATLSLKLARHLQGLGRDEEATRRILEVMQSDFPDLADQANDIFIRMIMSGAKRRPKEDDPYEILGVVRDTPLDEVKRAYRRLARTMHPDVNPSEDAAKMFMRLTKAYEKIVEDKQGTRPTPEATPEQEQAAAEAEEDLRAEEAANIFDEVNKWAEQEAAERRAERRCPPHACLGRR